MKPVFVFAYKLIWALPLICSIYACKKEGASCVDSRGPQSREERKPGAFEHINLQGRIDVVFVQDTLDFVYVEYGKNGLSGITTAVTNGTLKIDEQNACDWMRQTFPLPLVEVHYTNLRSIYSENAGSVRFDNAFTGDSLLLEIMDVSGSISMQVETPQLEVIVHTGATDVNVRGTTAYFYLYNSGYAPVYAEDLVARTVSVHNNSRADSYVRAWEKLYYQIHNEGSIFIYGNPDIDKWHHSGSGHLFLMEQ